MPTDDDDEIPNGASGGLIAKHRREEKKYKEWKNALIQDPQIMAGEVVLPGSRLMVSFVGELYDRFPNIEEMKRDYPRLTDDDILFCHRYWKETRMPANYRRIYLSVPGLNDRDPERNAILAWLNTEHCGNPIPPEEVSKEHMDAAYAIRRSTSMSLLVRTHKDGSIEPLELEMNGKQYKLVGKKA